MIQKFASESKITKHRARLENISVRKADSLFFDIPNFIHVERSNLPKVLQAVGNVDANSKFDGRSESAKKSAVKNFELLDIILAKMEKNIC